MLSMCIKRSNIRHPPTFFHSSFIQLCLFNSHLLMSYFYNRLWYFFFFCINFPADENRRSFVVHSFVLAIFYEHSFSVPFHATCFHNSTSYCLFYNTNLNIKQIKCFEIPMFLSYVVFFFFLIVINLYGHKKNMVFCIRILLPFYDILTNDFPNKQNYT